MNWKIESDNDTGPNDDFYREWWTVTDGNRRFDCKDEADAEWLAAMLNKIPNP